jgi:hypothetical protein
MFWRANKGASCERFGVVTIRKVGNAGLVVKQKSKCYTDFYTAESKCVGDYYLTMGNLVRKAMFCDDATYNQCVDAATAASNSCEVSVACPL